LLSSLPLRRGHASPSTTAAATALGLVLLAATALASPSQGGQRRSGAELEQRDYAITPERQALLNTIRYAEGTWKQGGEGYRTLYGGGRFGSLSRHPEIVVNKRYRSAAAGAYQFLPNTWREAAERLELRSFNPRSQDQAALYLVDRRGVLEQVDRLGLTREVMAVLAREWASFPSAHGGSAYGQPVKTAEELARFYQDNLASLRG
jgi:lysozyme